MCNQLSAFIASQGKRPNEDDIFDQTRTFPDHGKEYNRRCQEEIVPWDNKISAGYWRNFKTEIVNLRHDLVLAGLTDDSLDKALMAADRAPDNQYAKHLREIVERMRVLASKLG